MSYVIRPADVADVPLLLEIEKEAFPTTWPPTPFKREIPNGRVSYLVACHLPRGKQPLGRAPEEGEHPADRSVSPRLRGLWGWLGGLFPREAPSSPPPDLVAGYVSTMFMADEAHITAIAVRDTLRGQGVGELLLLASIELATKRQARVVTLEVRVSNHVAQSLYTKYGFNNVGMRRGYYSDNHEDAYIMTTAPIFSPSYREHFQRLLETYKARRGKAVLVLG